MEVLRLSCLVSMVTLAPEVLHPVHTAYGSFSYSANSGRLRDKLLATPEVVGAGLGLGAGGVREWSKLT